MSCVEMLQQAILTALGTTAGLDYSPSINSNKRKNGINRKRAYLTGVADILKANQVSGIKRTFSVNWIL